MMSLATLAVAITAATATFDDLRKELGTHPQGGDVSVAAFLSGAGGTPVIEGDWAIFIVKGSPDRPPRLVGDFNGWGEGDPHASILERLGATSFFFKKVKLHPAARVEYLIATGGHESLDPLNPARVDGFAEPHSEVRMPGYLPPLEIQVDPAPPRGRVVSFEHESGVLGNHRRVHVYLPPGYDRDVERRYPEAWFGDGSVYVERVHVPQILDHLIARGRIEPVLAVLVDPADRRVEYAGHEGYRRMMASELVPRVAREFRVLARGERRLIAGGSRGGQSAIDLALGHPDVFGLCGAWAPAVAPRRVADLLLDRTPRARFFLIQALYDQEWGPDASALRDDLTARGARVRYSQLPEGHTLATWRGVVDDVLEEFFPARPHDANKRAGAPISRGREEVRRRPVPVP